jgi:hypothetical protein
VSLFVAFAVELGPTLLDLLVTLTVGVAALLVAIVRRMAAAVDGRRGRLGMAVLLLLGGLAVGVLAEAADLLGGNPRDVLSPASRRCRRS